MWHDFVHQTHKVNSLLQNIIISPNKVYFQAIPGYFAENNHPIEVKSMMGALKLSGDWDFVHESIPDSEILSVLINKKEDYCDNVYLFNWYLLNNEPALFKGKDYIDYILNYEREYEDLFFAEFGVILLVELKRLIVLDKKGYYFSVTPES